MISAHSTSFCCASALSTHSEWKLALDEAIEAARNSLGGAPGLGLIFFSHHHAAAADKIAAAASKRLAPAALIGCTGESIAGTSQEIEDEPALSLWLARWPKVELTPMHLRFERTPEGG